MNKMIKDSVYYILFIFFSVILVQKMVSDNLNSGHFGYTQMKRIGTIGQHICHRCNGPHKNARTRNNSEDRLYWKVEISKILYEHEYPEMKVIALLNFIDWLMVLPRKLSESYDSTIHQIQEKKKDEIFKHL